MACATPRSHPDNIRVDHSLSIAIEGANVSLVASASQMEVAKACARFLERNVPLIESNMECRLPEGKRLAFSLHGVQTTFGMHYLSDDINGQTVGGVSYVLVMPRSDSDLLELCDGLPQATAFVAAHEATHQLSQRVRLVDLPDWLAEGEADYLAEKCVTGDSGAITVHSQSALSYVREELRCNRMMALNDVLMADLPASDNAYRVEAHAFALYAYLVTRRSEWDRFRSAVKNNAMAAGLTKSARTNKVREQFTACFDSIETDWHMFLRRLPLEWAEPMQGFQCEITGDVLVCATLPKNMEVVLHRAEPLSLDSTFSCEIAIAEVGQHQAQLILGYVAEDQRFLAVTFDVSGTVSLDTYAKGDWQKDRRISSDKHAALSCNHWYRAHVELRRTTNRIAIFLDDERVLETELPDKDSLPRSASWGFGARDSVARFKNTVVDGHAVAIGQ
jgi:hypothetical protein